MIVKRIKNTINQIKEDIDAVFDRDPAARNAFEVLMTYPGLHATLMHRAAHGLWNKDQKFIAKNIAYVSRAITGIEIHPAAKIGKRFFIDHGMGVVIGETAEIGDDVTLYQGVTLGGVSLNKGKRHPTLENGVVVGAGAKVLGPFTVGKNAKIGSNAVVVKPVPENATMVGTAARMIQINMKNDTKTQKEATSDDVRSALAKAIGFHAYGAIPNSPDPVVEGFKKLIEHLNNTDEQINTLKAAVCKIDPEFCASELQSLTAQDMSIMAEEVKKQEQLKD